MLSLSLLGDDYNCSACRESARKSYNVMVRYARAQESHLLEQG